MKTLNTVTLDRQQFSKTPDGFLKAAARITRTGVFAYMPSELGTTAAAEGLKDGEQILLYRSPENLFSQDTMKSFEMKPVTVDHKGGQVGTIGSRLVQDGDHLLADIMVMDKDAVAGVDNGKLELSVGMRSKMIRQDGETERGERFTHIQLDMKGDHVSLVENGRCGTSCSIVTSIDRENKPMSTITLDGLSVEIESAQGAQIITRTVDSLNARIVELEADLTMAGEQIKTVTTDSESQVAKLTEELKTAKESILTSDQVAELVKAKVDFGVKLESLDSKVDFTGMTEQQAKAAFVAEKVESFDAEGKSDDFINGMFETLSVEKEDTSALTNGNVEEQTKLSGREAFLNLEVK